MNEKPRYVPGDLLVPENKKVNAFIQIIIAVEPTQHLYYIMRADPNSIFCKINWENCQWSDKYDVLVPTK